ncbi:putative YhdH/YhfP family quinone oxidoreductase [Paenibacillus harenae]|nr:oxidoreductase [Paenibacillus harenae]MDQ0062253.1 putative YhdH/YhfP family quinone oxidoreductase [Paenibacillus harenae]
MDMDSYRALVLEKQDEEVIAQVKMLGLNDLPGGDLLIKVAYSSVNYKDALACKAGGNIVRSYPFVPGIDLAGVVVTCDSGLYREGDEVLVTGYGLGVSHYGGYSEYARVPSQWAVKLPAGLSMKNTMALGTAGFTAALSLFELERDGLSPDKGPLLVTGASGGVGSMAIAIASKLGYEVTASSGKSDMSGYLLGLGAKRVVSRDEIVPQTSAPLGKQLWAGAVDCVGGKTLATIIASLNYGGAVAASGMTGGIDLATSVYPFILRGVRLIGIDSVMARMEKRLRVWELLAGRYKLDKLDVMSEVIGLEEVAAYTKRMLAGDSRKRMVVKL